MYRKGVLIGVNVDVANNNSRDLSLALLPGDSLFISRNDPFVQVIGAVYSPQLTRYESGSFKSYISAAGGVKTELHYRRLIYNMEMELIKSKSTFCFLNFIQE